MQPKQRSRHRFHTSRFWNIRCHVCLDVSLYVLYGYLLLEILGLTGLWTAGVSHAWLPQNHPGEAGYQEITQPCQVQWQLVSWHQLKGWIFEAESVQAVNLEQSKASTPGVGGFHRYIEEFRYYGKVNWCLMVDLQVRFFFHENSHPVQPNPNNIYIYFSKLGSLK